MQWDIQLSELNFDDRERLAVERVIQSEWLTMGEECSKFEIEFQDFIEHENKGVFVSSATAGLHLILMALDVKKGDEIIIPALTFVSDANVILQLGATPVFADSVSLTDFNVSIDDIISKITSKTKAIVIVHFAGFPMKLEKLKLICQQKEIKLIEDCAHAPGASYNSKMCGSFGDFSFFSFFSNKNLAVGEGGMVFSKDTILNDKIRLMRSHGMDRVTLERHLGRAISYDVKVPGLNYRADEIRAAIGREQLQKLMGGNARRKEIYDIYVKLFKGSNILPAFNFHCAKTIAAYHIMPIMLPLNVDRNNIINELKNKGIQTSIHYPNFKAFKAYAKIASEYETPIADSITNRTLTIPLHPRMVAHDAEKVARTLLELI